MKIARPRALVPMLVALALGLPPLDRAAAQTPKRGGTLTVMQREDPPQGFNVHETSTISVVWPASPCFNNLVMFDPPSDWRRRRRSFPNSPRSGRGSPATGTSSCFSGRT